jgi:hypothetical protein
MISVRTFARVAALAGAAATIVAGTALTANAYPRPAGSVSGSCSPAGQSSVPVGSIASPLTCTFSLVDYNGAPNAGSFSGTLTKSGYDNSSTPVSGTGSSFIASVAGATCGSTGTLAETVQLTINGAADALNASGQAFATVTCVKPTTTVTGTGCSNGVATPFFPVGWEQSACSWTTSAANGTGVSYSTTPAPGKNSFVYGGQSSVAGGGFNATVYTTGNTLVTGVVATTATLEGNSASQGVPYI